MKINEKSITHELKHAKNLKLKISREVADDLVSDNDKLVSLEHKKHIVDAIHKSAHHNSRSKSKHDAIRYELANEDI